MTVVEIGLITPPTGLNVFVVNRLARDVRLWVTFRGVLPFLFFRPVTSGHFNTIGHITAELILRGKRHDVNSYDCMDHSWSRRTEVSRRAVGYLSACFGDNPASDRCGHGRQVLRSTSSCP